MWSKTSKSTFKKGGAKPLNLILLWNCKVDPNPSKFSFNFSGFAPLFLKVEKVELYIYYKMNLKIFI